VVPAFRRDRKSDAPEVGALIRALEGDAAVSATGLILQELLQGFSGPKARAQLLERFLTVPLVIPDRQDHIDAAELRNRCRRAGAQIGTIDALLAQLCIHHDLTMLSADTDFRSIAERSPLKVWAPA
jgi:predicted nucleic acid-binding protein